MSNTLPPLVVIALLLVFTPALAQTADPEQAKHYRYCTKLSKSEPSKAMSEAMSWRDLGGGLAAEHCLAKAQVGLKQYDQAAQRLEAIANHERVQLSLRPDLFAQAGQVWTLAEDLARAEAAYSAALELTPDRPDYLIERAIVRASQKQYTDAIQDLNRAIQFDTTNTDAFVFRASALRSQGRLDDAERDITSALSINPSHIGALLERGLLFKAYGDADMARKDWLRILELSPDSPSADAARAHIENLDVNKDG